jgi:hypothetical protein
VFTHLSVNEISREGKLINFQAEQNHGEDDKGDEEPDNVVQDKE